MFFFGRVNIFKIRYFHFLGIKQKYGKLKVNFWSQKHNYQVSSNHLNTVGGYKFKTFKAVLWELRLKFARAM